MKKRKRMIGKKRTSMAGHEQHAGDGYGICACGISLGPVWFDEEELVMDGGRQVKTGRKRRACSHLICSGCGKSYAVDDTFDGPWERPAHGI